MSTRTKDDPRDQLATDLRAVVADAEELLKATAGLTGDRVTAARARAEETVQSAVRRLGELDESVIDEVRDAAGTVDRYAHDHPWGVAGAAALAGLLLGVLVSRR